MDVLIALLGEALIVFLGTVFFAPHMVVSGWTRARFLFLLLGIVTLGAVASGLIAWIAATQGTTVAELTGRPSFYLPILGVAAWIALPVILGASTAKNEGAVILVVPIMLFFPALLFAGPLAAVLSWPESNWARFLFMPLMILVLLLPLYLIVPATLPLLDRLGILGMLPEPPAPGPAPGD